MYNEENAPVLLIIFNRPDTLKRVFEAIRKAKPSKLYISADGPRPGNESDLINCEKARNIVKEIDWVCDTHYRFLDHNLGCGYGPSSAISWAFKNEDRLIIIEDDCVPSQSLFKYHNYLLEKFKNDTRIWLISGRSHQQNSNYFKSVDYIFSHYGHSLGWSTWKRCWNYFDIEMTNTENFLNSGGASNVLFTSKEYNTYNIKLKEWASDKNLSKHSWDIQFGISIISNGGLSIVPAKNLVIHIGIMGTHYNMNKKNRTDKLALCNDFVIKKEPIFIVANRDYDLYHFNRHMIKLLKNTPIYKLLIHKCLIILGLR